jgi:hypothetical protein
MGAFPWELRVDGVNGGANLLTLPTYAQAGTPFVLPESVSVSQAANGGGASISFEVMEPLSIGSPWFALSTLNDNARVRFFDTRYSGSTPIALGYITSIDVELLPNGVGTKASVTASDPTGWLEKIVVRKGKIGSATQQPVGNFTAAGTTDQQIITSILGYVNGASSGSYTQDAATKLIFDASLAPTYVGTATTIATSAKPYLVEVQTLASVLDSIRSLAEGVDGVIRRYWVDATGKLNYGRTGTAPANPTAPFAVITTGTPVTGSSSARTTVYANALTVNLDHDATIDRIFTKAASYQSDLDRGRGSLSDRSGAFTTGNTVDPYVRTAGSAAPRGPGTAYARSGPRAEQLFELGSFRGLDNVNRADYIDRFTGATFNLNYQPKRTISLSIVGSGSSTANPDHEYGFVQGYTGGSPFTLTKRIQAGDYLLLTAPALDLGTATMFRIESLTLGFEPGSSTARLDLELNFRKKGLREIILGES